MNAFFSRWHFNIYEQENFHAQLVEHENSFITTGPGFQHKSVVIEMMNVGGRVAGCHHFVPENNSATVRKNLMKLERIIEQVSAESCVPAGTQGRND